MKRILIAGAFALASLVPALAADLPPPMPAPPPPRAPAVYMPAPPPIYNWTGFYVGINGGYGFGTASTSSTTAGSTLPASLGGVSGNLTGPLAGGTVGFNYQWSSIVLGLEGDFDWSNQSRSTSFNCVVCGGTVNENYKLPWVSTARARVGYAFDRILIFGTGGLAYSNVTSNPTYSGGSLWNMSSWTAGWVAGGGAEVALAPNWTAKAEYLFAQTKPTLNGSLNTAVGGTVSQKGTINDNLARAGINYKFAF